MQNTTSAIEIAQLVLKNNLPQAKIVVDATAGNGNDTLFLAENAPGAQIYAFDVQPMAIAATKEKTAAYKERITYIMDSHANIQKIVPDGIDAAMFNLGYLPGGNHEVTTEARITIEAVEQTVNKLSLNGLLAIVVYPGHPAGAEEEEALGEYIHLLPAEKFTVGCYRLENHVGNGPFVYIIEKVRG